MTPSLNIEFSIKITQARQKTVAFAHSSQILANNYQSLIMGVMYRLILRLSRTSSLITFIGGKIVEQQQLQSIKQFPHLLLNKFPPM